MSDREPTFHTQRPRPDLAIRGNPRPVKHSLTQTKRFGKTRIMIWYTPPLCPCVPTPAIASEGSTPTSEVHTMGCSREYFHRNEFRLEKTCNSTFFPRNLCKVERDLFSTGESTLSRNRRIRGTAPRQDRGAMP
ncbi:hypothetical protein B0H19DRAFT_595064 [Mycena capillaripes]|nr:hypothetical protein B0H19DRAFT_595064 [Mycena capillaripes]